MAPGGDLRSFIYRFHVLNQYRQFLRASRSAPAGSRSEVLTEVRRDFEVTRHVTDPTTIKYLLSEGRVRLKQLSDMFGLQLSR